uniref:Uncharacterized protein n=1 Tax=Ciona savignyi TaxID=51511 RepID=H2YRW3_CIOSA
ILQRKLRSTPSTGTKLSWKIDSPPQTQHSSLSVVVPASYEEPPSLPSTPLPPAIVEPSLDQSAETVLTPEPPHVTSMGSGAAKLFRCDLQTKDVTSICDDASMTKAADTEIQCVVELCDGKKIPADIDFGGSRGEET